MRRIVLLLCLFICFSFIEAYGNNSEKGLVRMSASVLKDKIMGGWAAKTIGCTYGGPVEFTQNGTMIQDYTPIKWSDDRVKYYFDIFPGLYDDIYVDIVFVNVIDRLGLEAPADSFAVSFVNAGFPLWHANQVAKYNISHGIMPPMSGHWLNNPHADDIDYQIECDFAGLMTPGMPNSASEISDKVGHIFTYGDGWYGGVFVGALYSQAFVNDNMEELVRNALKTIPQNSDFYKCINDVLDCYKNNHDDWKYAWYVCQKKWSSEVGCPDGVFLPFDIDAKINSAYVTIGLLYGQKDFYKTIDIAARCGQDSDCNSATAGGILGTVLGYSNIPQQWKASLNGIEDMPFAYTTISLNKLYDMSYNHAISMIKKNKGKVNEKEVYIKVQEPVAVRYEKSFEGHYPTDKIINNVSFGKEMSFDITGIGFVQKGYVKCPDNDYVANIDIYIDGMLSEKINLPVGKDNSLDKRRVDLFWKYQMRNSKHNIKVKWNNKRDDAQIVFTEVVIYSDKPSTVKY